MTLLVKQVEVRGLHGRSDIELALEPDVNILFGRNGSGKTTLLHIIANVLAGSIERFAYLKFDLVRIASFDGSTISIRRTHDGVSTPNDLIEVSLGDEQVVAFRPYIVHQFEDGVHASIF